MAIQLTNPIVIPAVEKIILDKSQITDIQLHFYLDGKTMLNAGANVTYRNGAGDGSNFVQTSINTVDIDASQLLLIISMSKDIDVIEILCPQLGVTPVDRLFSAIVLWMKMHGDL